ncbi:unnamed protein product [Amoebophrya sp. A25]|nr:unnamed protein product [Amoebophrya sp. A25]|eukprot:GSA25T00026644001.1
MAKNTFERSEQASSSSSMEHHQAKSSMQNQGKKTSSLTVSPKKNHEEQEASTSTDKAARNGTATSATSPSSVHKGDDVEKKRAQQHDPVALRCSCKCGSCVFVVDNVNGNLAKGVQILNCHCRGCRKHAGAAWASYLTRNGQPFDFATDISVASEEFEEIEVVCSTLNKFHGEDASEDAEGGQENGQRNGAINAEGGAATDASSANGESHIVASKVLCKLCHSVLMMRFGPDKSRVVVAAGAIDDGDYEDDDAGRIPCEERWPEKKYPLVLRPSAVVTRNVSLDERAGWYVNKAGITEKKYKQREKEVRQATATSAGLPWEDPEVTGSCYCGSCRFEARIFPPELQHCYCSMCRKLSGAAFQTWAWVYNKNLRWVDGTSKGTKNGAKAGGRLPPSLAFEQTSDEGGRHFCKTCGTCMSIVYDDEKKTTTWLAAGCYDDDSLRERSSSTTVSIAQNKNVVANKSKSKKSGQEVNGSTNKSQPNGNYGKWKVDTTDEENLVDSQQKELQEQLEYVWRRVHFVGHICCLSVQPWYKVPDDVGSARFDHAG